MTEQTPAPRPPWWDAEIKNSNIPQQASLYPRPMVLECRRCLRTGWWYPKANSLEIPGTTTACDGGPTHTPRWRKYHDWAVDGWNGHDHDPALPLTVSLADWQDATG